MVTTATQVQGLNTTQRQQCWPDGTHACLEVHVQPAEGMSLACLRACCCRCASYPEECDQIIAMAAPRLEQSVVVANDKSDETNTTKLVPSKIRTSMGMFFKRGENELVQGG